MKLANLREKCIAENNLAMALIIDSKGYNLNAEVSQGMIDNFNKTAKNISDALDEWRMDNEEQFHEENEDFNDWNGDTLETQELFDCAEIDFSE